MCYYTVSLHSNSSMFCYTGYCAVLWPLISETITVKYGYISLIKKKVCLQMCADWENHVTKIAFQRNSHIWTCILMGLQIIKNIPYILMCVVKWWIKFISYRSTSSVGFSLLNSYVSLRSGVSVFHNTLIVHNIIYQILYEYFQLYSQLSRLSRKLPRK